MRVNPAVSIRSMSIAQLNKLKKKKKIIFNDEYQRTRVWSVKQNRNLVQSIIEKSPIGVLTVKKNNGKLEVLDGQQRISAISDFLRENGFTTNNNQKFNQLPENQRSAINAYKVYYLELNKSLTEEETSTIFMRLQEGTSLNTAERVNAFVGKFKTSFTNSFIQNNNFFKYVDNYRFRGRLLAAQFLVLELESNLEKHIFPSITYAFLAKINQKYKDIISKETIRNYNNRIKFLGNVLGKDITRLSPRDLIPFYLLAKYLQEHQQQKSTISSNIQKFNKKFVSELESFNVYDTEKPSSLSQAKFETLMKYKNIGRKATSKDSIHGRFDIMLGQYKDLFPSTKIVELQTNTLTEILGDESKDLELKSSMLWSYNDNKVNNELKHEIVKTITAFLNTKGGILLVGVGPTKETLGLENDFKSLGGTKDWDMWLLTLTSLINSQLGKEFHMFIDADSISEKGKIVAKITVKPSNKPAFIDPHGKAEFYIRGLNSSERLNAKQTSEYITSNFFVNTALLIKK